MNIPYFAYGSNMLFDRMVKRCPSAVKRGTTKVKYFKLTWDKVGADGSGKCNIENDTNSSVFGVLWVVSTIDLINLSKIERGYDPIYVECWYDQILYRNVVTFQKKKVVDILPTIEYHSIVMEGAIENKLPRDYIEAMKVIQTQPKMVI